MSAAFLINFAQSGRGFECGADQFVLDAGLAAGLRLPFACRRGICGTCKSRLLSGTYDMKHLCGITPREIESGLFLLCCSKPTSDLLIDK